MVDESSKPKQPNIVFRFLRGSLVFLRNYFTFIGIVVTVFPILLLVSYSRLQPKVATGPAFTYTKEAPASLSLDLSGPLEEREPGFSDLFRTRLFGGRRAVYLPELRAALRRAGADDRVSQLQIEISSLQGSPADYSELRRMLEEFRAKGKSLVAVLNEGDDWSYFVASAAEKVILNPASPLAITGPAYQLMYFGEALRKLGVGIDVVRAGKYKSAFEPLVEDEPTPPTLEEYQSMNASLLGYIVDVVARSRGKSPDEVRRWYAESIFTAQQALERGIVDEVGYPAPAGEGADKRVTLSDYASATLREPPLQPSVAGAGGIGLIRATGEIGMTEASGPTDDRISPLAMRKQIRWALKTADVKAVVLRVSSPGGSAIASDMIWNDLRELAEKKPLIVSMGAYAASGGYYISAPARKIFAEPTTITGSIGVIGMLPSFEAFKEKYGVSFFVVTESLRRSLLNPGTRPTQEDKALIEATIEQVYSTFLDKVAQGRKMPIDKVAQLAQGRVYTGLEAKQLALVDEIGGLQAAFNSAKEMAGFDVNSLYPVLQYEGDELSLSECFRSMPNMMRCLSEGSASSRGALALAPPIGEDLVTGAAARARAWLEMSERERALALWPAWVGVRLR